MQELEPVQRAPKNIPAKARKPRLDCRGRALSTLCLVALCVRGSDLPGSNRLMSEATPGKEPSATSLYSLAYPLDLLKEVKGASVGSCGTRKGQRRCGGPI